MPIERVILELDATALYAARFVSEAQGVPLSDWISRVVRDQAIAEAMQAHVVSPAPPGWEGETLERLFGDEDE
ncbi:hypothetical protein OHA21_36250 [Actinoplanes sp. NBC_00393]|uniref:hypothetical protein n=1 Tax=Actinoplanes sp. NBC_00393 TaxID=2975953 RepID=UPI002E21F9D6